MNLDEYFTLAKENDPKIVEIYPEQRNMASNLYLALQKKNTVISAQGPVGMGKSLVICVVSSVLSDEGKRILICSPTYSHLTANIENTMEVLKKETVTLYGISRHFGKFKHKCLLGVANVSNTRPCNTCKEENCRIIQIRKAATEAEIVLTSHALLVSRSSIANDFDVIIIDECHGYPDVLRNAREELVSFDHFIKELERLEETSSALESDVKNIKKTFSKLSNKKGGYFLDKMKTQIQNLSITLGSLGIRSETFSYADRLYNLQKGESSFHFTKSRQKPNYNEDLSVGLVSATIEDPKSLVKECEFDKKIFAPTFQFKTLTKRFQDRFDRRPVFGLSDGPILRLAGGEYKELRKKANDTICELVKDFPDPILILCRNKSDANSIRKAFKQYDELILKRLFICDDILEEELDELESRINKRIELGKNVIVATASSRLWEGANIEGIKLLIIDALPYRRMTSEESKKGFRGWYKRPPFWFMIRRMQQGIGRLVRKDGDWGIALIIDGRLYSGKRMIFNNLPEWIVGDHIFRWTLSEALTKEVMTIRKRLSKGKLGRKYERIDSYGGN